MKGVHIVFPIDLVPLISGKPKTGLKSSTRIEAVPMYPETVKMVLNRKKASARTCRLVWLSTCE